MANPFKDIISSLFKKEAPSSVLGIDIGSSSVKIVQVKKHHGKALLETYGALSLAPYAGGEVGQVSNLNVDQTVQALTDILKEANTTTKVGAISIPSSASLIFTIELPGTITEADLPNVIPTEARKYIPVPIADVTLDWWMIPRQAESVDEADPNNAGKLPEAKTEVLVVAIHNDTLNKYREVLDKTGISSNFFEMEVFSSIRSTFAHEIAPVLLMDFGASKTKLSVIEYGIVKTFHVVNRGGQDLTKNIAQSLNMSFKDAEEVKREVGLDSTKNKQIADINKLSIDYIMAETNSVVLAYEKKYNKTIGKIILSGGGALLKGLHTRATVAFRAEVVSGEAFGKVEAPAFLAPVLATSGPEFAVSIGLALRQLS